VALFIAQGLRHALRLNAIYDLRRRVLRIHSRKLPRRRSAYEEPDQTDTVNAGRLDAFAVFFRTGAGNVLNLGQAHSKPAVLHIRGFGCRAPTQRISRPTKWRI
jgi:hypothetical protein